MSIIRTRPANTSHVQALTASGLSPLFARLYAARGVGTPSDLETGLDQLIPYHQLKNADVAACRLADAIARQQQLLIVADYDSDGATACAVAMRALSAMGARVDFIVPNRFEYGYGLTPEIVELARHKQPDLLITVDNGIASIDGIEAARAHGIEVLVTDHHLPGDRLPETLIVNPNQPGCPFPSKHLAGVGVIFYVMLALRAELRRRGAFGEGSGPNLGNLLDLVALGTVADVVKLDHNNRVLVSQGLARMRAGRAIPGILGLFRVAGRQFVQASCFDLGFTLGPRLNAAGRLDDMSQGIACLLTDDPDHALSLASELDRLNRERRAIETNMQEEALAILDGLDVEDRYAIGLYRHDWHQGVIGILASRVKDRFHRPTIVFAPGNAGEIKGSGRSIGPLHLRDALDLVSKRHPDLILKFGGHAAAAGLTIRDHDFERFKIAFDAAARQMLEANDLNREILTDGELGQREFTLDNAVSLNRQVWGQGFPQPAFHGEFQVANQRVVGEKHLKLKLATQGQVLDAMLFNHADPLPERVRAVYRLTANEFNGNTSLQLILEHWEAP
ncbi:single-stranded-DNA-specific exonuclease [Chitinivorax tropicus]|uniref:Single-stranded-DNA-specific exonuclease RecJ n=1 Tax=Chitinivorax tropicus TaxID=714531 RepID=A0A840MJJ8_9PROT|nr:single-stranded-DNA-specific exonuclease RecJ [Chitinivorax tropicus]MBB5018818.1 single-stranded-DNA-specific exonuclease [Chitinivorax tropicus]